MAAAPAFALSPKLALKRHVRALISSDLRGRASGTAGGDDARDYVQKAFSAVGLSAAGERGWEVATEVVVDLSAKASLELGKHVLADEAEFVVTGFSDSGKWQGEPVFVGYGLSDPRLGWDDYAGIDVRGKVVVALTGAPAALKSEFEQDHEWQLTPEARAAVALSKGAVGIILVNDPGTYGDGDYQRADELPDVRPDLALSGMMVLRMTQRVALRSFGAEFASLQQTLANSQPVSRVLPVRTSLSVAMDRDFEGAASVVGVVDGTEGPPLVIMAHFDGLGDQPDGAFDLEYEGADDNASGVAVLIEAARRLVASPPKGRTVIFVASDAEERGLRGARRVARLIRERHGLGTVVNMDMVGRMRDEVIRVEARDALMETAESASSGLTAVRQPSGTAHSDHIAFAEVGFESIHLTTGRHADYHRVTDTIDQIDFDGMVSVVGYVERLAHLLSAR